jgi:hypothetical protein
MNQSKFVEVSTIVFFDIFMLFAIWLTVTYPITDVNGVKDEKLTLFFVGSEIILTLWANTVYWLNSKFPVQEKK